MYWAVPVFLMITGALLLNPEKDISYKKCFLYARRVLLALALFGTVFALFMMVGSHQSINIGKALLSVFEGKSFAHLWYLYVLIGIYLTLPVFKAFINSASRETIEVLLLVLFVFDFIASMAKAAGHATGFSVPITWPVFYLILGYYCKNFDTLLFKFRYLILAVSALVLGVIAYQNPVLDNLWIGYNSPVVALMAMSVFMIFMNIDMKQSELLWKIDRLCFCVYLIHPLFIQATYRVLKITPMRFGVTWLGTAVMFVIFTVCSFVFSYIASLIKPLRKFVL